MAAKHRVRRNSRNIIRLSKARIGRGYTADVSFDGGTTWTPTSRRETGTGQGSGTRQEWRIEARRRKAVLWEQRPAKYASNRQTRAA